MNVGVCVNGSVVGTVVGSSIFDCWLTIACVRQPWDIINLEQYRLRNRLIKTQSMKEGSSCCTMLESEYSVHHMLVRRCTIADNVHVTRHYVHPLWLWMYSASVIMMMIGRAISGGTVITQANPNQSGSDPNRPKSDDCKGGSTWKISGHLGQNN